MAPGSASRALVVCCDGTWSRARSPSPTNVAKIAVTIADRDADGCEQRVLYHEGVGVRRAERLAGGAFGTGLSRNVKDCYRFLAHEYEPGDRIYLFGFSRGAYTARSLAGLIRNCGVLMPDQLDRCHEAYRLYRDRATDPYSIEASLFRRTYAREVPVHFIGVWDTVGSLGVPFRIPLIRRRWEFHDVGLSRTVRFAFQALAIDERRRPFRPAVWVQHPEVGETVSQTLEQVWFSGSHSDVGGGSAHPALSEIPLCWMAQKAVDAGLAFRDDAFRRLDPVLAPALPDECQNDFTGVTAHFTRLAFAAAARAPWSPPRVPTAEELEMRRARATARLVDPDPAGCCHDSMSALYLPLRPKWRPIPYLEGPGLDQPLDAATLARLSDQRVAASAALHAALPEQRPHSPRLRDRLARRPAPQTVPVPTARDVPPGGQVVCSARSEGDRGAVPPSLYAGSFVRQGG